MTPLQMLFANLMGLLTFSCLSSQALKITITTQPSSVNTSANSEVTFICAAENADLFFWYLNNTYVKYIEGLLSDIETEDTSVPPSSILKLTIPKETGHLNNSMIKCKALSYDSNSNSTPAESSEALLLIQGPIEPVHNLNVTKDCEKQLLNLSWTRPYTLDGVSIPSYNMCVDLNCSEHVGDVDRIALPFPAINASFADNYDVCIQPFDCTSDIFTEFSCTSISLNSVPNWISYLDVKSKLTYTSSAFEVHVTVDLDEETICQLPQYYTVSLTRPNGIIESFNLKIIHQTKEGVSLVIMVDEQAQQTQASLRIMPTNSAGSNSSDPIPIALFHVQGASLNESNNNVTCTFVDGSNAQGCSTTLICVNGTSEALLDACEMNRTNQADYYATGSILCQGVLFNCTSYDVHVYDIFSNGHVSYQEAYVLRDVTITPPTSQTFNYDYLWLASTVLIIPICICLPILVRNIRKKYCTSRRYERIYTDEDI